MSGVLPGIESVSGTAPRGSSNIRHLCRMELAGGGQIVIDGNYAYIGHQHRPQGTTILDVADPRKPKVISTIEPGHPSSHSHKARIVGDLLFVNSEFERGHGRREEYPDGGFRIYDVKDRTRPKLMTFVKTHGKGVHRFDVDENYAYISTEAEGFVGNILVIYDIRNPAKPVEVSRWSMEQQNVAGGAAPHPKRAEHRLHHAMRCGAEMYAGCWMSGISIIDVSDIRAPRTLSRYEYDPPCPEPTHTFLKAPHPIGGRQIAVSTEEERSQRGADTRQAARAAAHLGRDRSEKAAAAPFLFSAGERDALSRRTRSASARTSSARKSTRTIYFTLPGSPAGCALSTSTIRRSPKSAATSFQNRATGWRRR